MKSPAHLFPRMVLVAVWLGVGVSGWCAPAEPAAPVPAVAPPKESKFTSTFAPLRSSRAALSPDGTKVAYTVRSGDRTGVIVADSATPSVPTASVIVGTDGDATPALGAREDFPLVVGFLGWATDNRLVLSTNAFHNAAEKMSPFPVGGEVLAVDADGKNAKALAVPDDIVQRDVVLRRRATSRGTSGIGNATLKHSAGAGAIHLPTPDQSAAQTDSAQNASVGPDDRGDASQGGVPMQTLRLPPSIFELSSGEPDTLLVKGGSGARYSICRINIHTGKITRQTDYEVDQSLLPLLDRTGRPRIGIPWSPSTPYPWTLRFDLAETGKAAKHDLAELLPEPARSHLALTRDNFFGERAVVLGFDYDPAILYFATNVGRDTFAVYATNVATGQPTAVELAVAGVDLAMRSAEGFGDEAALVYDRYARRVAGVRYRDLRRRTAWIEPEFEDLQAQIEGVFPGQSVELLEWDQSRRHFLLRVSGPVDAGAHYVFDRKEQKALEFAKRSASPDAPRPHRVFERRITRAEGTVLTGRLIMPRAARLRPVPVLIRCASDPFAAVSPHFDPEIVAFADMGLAVLQVNVRGTEGFGLKLLHGVEEGHEAAQIDDLLAVLDDAAKTFAIDARRVAITGKRYGGYLALRAMQLHPERFRGALARDPFVDLRDELIPPVGGGAWLRLDAERRRWFFGEETRLAKTSLLASPAPLARPTLIVGEAGTARYRAARRFADAQRGAGAPVEMINPEVEASWGLPKAQARLFVRFEEFLNLALYDFGVNLGPMEEVPLPEGGP